MNIKKITSLFVSAGFLVGALPVFAQNTPPATSTQPTVAVKQAVTITPRGEVVLQGKLKAVNASSLVVTSWGGDWVLNFSPTTKFLRRFDGTATLAEFSIGDAISAHGKINTSAAWTIDATKVKDDSIQTYDAVFVGVISNLSGNTFNLTTTRGFTLKVTVAADAKIMVNDKAGTLVDLANGKAVVASGLWNTQLSLLSANKVVVRIQAEPVLKIIRGLGKKLEVHDNRNGEKDNK